MSEWACDRWIDRRCKLPAVHFYVQIRAGGDHESYRCELHRRELHVYYGYAVMTKEEMEVRRVMTR